MVVFVLSCENAVQISLVDVLTTVAQR